MKNIIFVSVLAMLVTSCYTNDAECTFKLGKGIVEEISPGKDGYHTKVVLSCISFEGGLPFQYDLANYGSKNLKTLNVGDEVIVYRNDRNRDLFLTSRELSQEMLAELTHRANDRTMEAVVWGVCFLVGLVIGITIGKA